VVDTVEDTVEVMVEVMAEDTTRVKSLIVANLWIQLSPRDADVTSAPTITVRTTSTITVPDTMTTITASKDRGPSATTISVTIGQIGITIITISITSHTWNIFHMMTITAVVMEEHAFH